jgi:hypothetical protein
MTFLSGMGENLIWMTADAPAVILVGLMVATCGW